VGVSAEGEDEVRGQVVGENFAQIMANKNISSHSWEPRRNQNFPRWNFCHFSFSSTEHTFPLKAIFKNLFSVLGFLMTHDLAFPKYGSVQ